MRKICRLCLVEAPITYPLLNNKRAEMLQMLTSITLNADEQISHACLKCSLNLKLAYTIQQKILRSQETLKKRLLDNRNNIEETETVHVKEEICETATSICIICNTFIRNERLSLHIEDHFNEKQFCTLCNDSFSNLETYRHHLPQHPDSSPYKCDICDLAFRYHSFYTIHMNSHTEPSKRKSSNERLSKDLDKFQKKGVGTNQAEKLLTTSKKVASNVPPPRPASPQNYKCNVCNRQFTDRLQFRRHQTGHQRRECPICHKHITNHNFCKHVRNHNSGPQVCEQCGKLYDSALKLQAHVTYMHTTKKFECEECKITFKNRHRLSDHRNREHNGSGHICETCGRKFLYGYWLKKHIEATHLKMKPHICEFCNRAFSAKSALRTHRRQHTLETPYKCEVCGEGFRQNVSLKSHMKSKHDIVETLICECEVCGKGFASKHAMMSHMKCH